MLLSPLLDDSSSNLSSDFDDANKGGTTGGELDLCILSSCDKDGGEKAEAEPISDNAIANAERDTVLEVRIRSRRRGEHILFFISQIENRKERQPGEFGYRICITTGST